jgi:hypothetical protein
LEATEAVAAWAASALEKVGMAVDVAFDGGQDSWDDEENKEGKEDEEDDGPVSSCIQHITGGAPCRDTMPKEILVSQEDWEDHPKLMQCTWMRLATRRTVILTQTQTLMRKKCIWKKCAYFVTPRARNMRALKQLQKQSKLEMHPPKSKEKLQEQYDK